MECVIVMQILNIYRGNNNDAFVVSKACLFTHCVICAVGVRRDLLAVWGIFGNALALR